MRKVVLNSLDKKYLSVAMPAAMEGVFMILLSNIDIILVGMLGLMEVAAVSIFTQPRMIILTLARSLAAAISLLAANYYGRQDKNLVYNMLFHSLFFWGIIFLIIHILFFFSMDSILLWMGAEVSYLDLALNYANIALIAVFITSVYTMMQAVMIGFGETKSVFRINLTANIINVIASIPLIFGFGVIPALGVAGAAIGTVIGTLYALIDTFLHMKKRGMLRIAKLKIREYLEEFLGIFGGVFAEQGFERVGMVLYTRMVAELGAVPYAVHAICMNFCDFYYCFAGGLGKASMVLSGQAFGAKNKVEWKNDMKIGVKWSLIFSAITCFFTYILREPIFQIYSTDPNALVLAMPLMTIIAVVSFPEAISLVCAGVLRGSGKTTAVAIYSFVSVAVLRPIITAFFLYSLGLGLIGAWLALFIDQSIRAGSAAFLLRKKFK